MMKKFFYTVALCAAFTTTSSFASAEGEGFIEQLMREADAAALQAHQYAYIPDLACEKWHMTDVLTKFKGATMPETQMRVDTRIVLINQSQSLQEATSHFCGILTSVMGDLQRAITQSAGYDAGPLPEGEIPAGIDAEKLTRRLENFEKTLSLFKASSKATPFMTLLCDGARRKAFYDILDARLFKEDEATSIDAAVAALENNEFTDMDQAFIGMLSNIDNFSPTLGDYFRSDVYLAPSFLARMFSQYLLSIDEDLQEMKKKLNKMVTQSPAPSRVGAAPRGCILHRQ